MRYITDTNINQINNTVVTIGNFDGMHLGHLELINKVKEYKLKYKLKSLVFSFYPHPRSVMKKEEIKTIFSREEKAFILGNLGIDIFVEYPFDKDFASISAENFSKIFLIDKLKCKTLVIGETNRFGNKNVKDDVGNIRSLLRYSGVDIIVVPDIKYKQEKISSSDIRNFILEGDLESANKFLSVPYFMRGTVVTGNKLGRVIGFKTANLLFDNFKLLPPDGVYISEVEIDNKKYKSITNIGKNPTVGSTYKRAETFILNFSDDIYYKKINVYLYKFVRGEVKFESLEELKNQIEKDVKLAKKFFTL